MDLLWADLINSDWRDHLGKGEREDRIGNDAWLAAFLERAGWRGTRLPDLKERDALRRMREFLVVVVDRVRQGRKMSLKDLARLNRYLAAAPVVRRLDAENGSATVLLAPAVTGIDAVLGEVAASFADMMATGDPTRIKICDPLPRGGARCATRRRRRARPRASPSTPPANGCGRPC